LITVIIPKKKEDWMTESSIGELNLKIKAYWYLPQSGNQISKNKSSKRIEIPLENLVNLEICPKLFNLLWDKNYHL